jgi:hypothetical protein
MTRPKSTSAKDSSANLGFEAKRWLARNKGLIYDPACGSGGMFVQSEKFVESHGGQLGDISIYGQESNPTTRRLAIMNLAQRGIEADLGPENADTFRRDLHPDLRADTATRVSAKPQPRSHLAGLMRSERQLLANPPFNDSDWFRKDDDVRRQSSGARKAAKGSPQGERGGAHQFGVPPKPARRESANIIPEGNPQVVSVARDNSANFAWVQHFTSK